MNFKTISLLSLSLLLSCGEAKKNKQSDFILQDISSNGGYRFADLPLEGTVTEGKNLWSGDHWPMNKSSINYRWQIGDKNFNNYRSPKLEELSIMSEDEISRLSPSEKVDILRGDYNYSFFKEIGSQINIIALAWEGIGDGWAAASVFHDEPTPVTLTNPDNIVVSFGSSDIKALLSYYYSKSHNAAKEQMGLRCNTAQEEAAEEISCNDDLTPAQFHLALARAVGLSKVPIIMDLDRYNQVWNHPIISYSSSIISEGDPAEKAPAGAVKTVGLKTKVTYLDRAYNHAWNPVKGTWNQVHTNRVYSYQLHLNANGAVIGSTWVSHDRPDFLWIPQRVSRFEGTLSLLNQLLVTHPEPQEQPEAPEIEEPETESSENE